MEWVQPLFFSLYFAGLSRLSAVLSPVTDDVATNTPMKNFILFFYFLFPAFALGGIEGVYSIDKAMLREAIQSTPEFASMAESQKQGLLGIADQMKLSLTLEADGTFVALAEIMGESQKGSGTFVQADAALIMKTTFENGVAKAEPEESRFRVDGETLVVEEAGMPFSFVLRRAK